MRTDCHWGGFPAWSQLGIHTALPGGFTDTENLLVDMGTVSGVGGPVHFISHSLEPAILVMHHSMKPHPAITATLLDFMCRVSATVAFMAPRPE